MENDEIFSEYPSVREKLEEGAIRLREILNEEDHEENLDVEKYTETIKKRLLFEAKKVISYVNAGGSSVGHPLISEMDRLFVVSDSPLLSENQKEKLQDGLLDCANALSEKFADHNREDVFDGILAHIEEKKQRLLGVASSK